jgi:ribosomal 50S subunit-recycling heat shock protein
LNGTPAKSAHTVKVGDEISIKRGNKISKLKVLAVPSERQMSKKDAGMLYEVLSEEQMDNDFDR